MANEEDNANAGGVSLCTVLFVVFLVLKLCGLIDWSWWWVTAPLWIPLAIVALLLGVMFCIVMLQGDK